MRAMRTQASRGAAWPSVNPLAGSVSAATLLLVICGLLMSCADAAQQPPPLDLDPALAAFSDLLAAEAEKEAAVREEKLGHDPCNSWYCWWYPAECSFCDETAEDASLYDMVLDITSLVDVATGWPLYLRDGSDTIEAMKMPSHTVSVLGVFNRGKTFLSNKLGGYTLGNGDLVHTEGLSVILPRHSDDEGTTFTIVDTAGAQQPVDLDDEDAPAKRRISQSFVQALAILVAQTNLIVVNRLTLSDQIYIRGVLNRIRENADTDEQGDIEVAERVVVVHNFRDYSSTEDVEKCIQTDIVDGFGATKSTFKLHGEERVFWKNQETGLRHVVLGREGFASGDHFNERTLSTLKQWMNDETKRATARTASKVILSRVVGFVNSHLGSFLQAPDPTQRLAVEYAMHPDTKAPVIRTREGVDSVSLRSGLKFDGECFVALNHVVQRFKPLMSVGHDDRHTYVVTDLQGIETCASDATFQCTGKNDIYQTCNVGAVTARVQLVPIGRKSANLVIAGSRDDPLTNSDDVTVQEKHRRFGAFGRDYGGLVNLPGTYQAASYNCTAGTVMFTLDHLDEDPASVVADPVRHDQSA